ncbi:MAG: hypothetical protein ACRDNH_10860 [Gaiellaceae bacterium]
MQPPANDAFANAQAISGLSGTVQGTTFAAGTETGEPMHDGYPWASIWYRWVPQFLTGLTLRRAKTGLARAGAASVG